MLSAKEYAVMTLIVVGVPNEEIARRLGIGLRTVEHHRRPVFLKMKVKRLADLVRKVC